MKIIRIINSIKSADGMATKYIQETDDNHHIETLYVDYPNKHIICYSTQIGCLGQCKFCYTGIEGRFIRDLTKEEIVEQCDNVIHQIKCNGYNDMMDVKGREESNKKPILFSAMGIGDPLDNLPDYMASIWILKDKYPSAKFALASRVNDYRDIGILAEYNRGRTIKLTISLHAGTDELRSKLIPRSTSVSELVKYGIYYEKFTMNEVEYNITLIDGVNDSDDNALEIVKLLKEPYEAAGLTPRIKLNKFNEIPNGTFKPSNRVNEFMEIIKTNGLSVEYYETNGSDIGGACGQMVSN